MKKLLLIFILAIASCAGAVASDYVPLLELGKTWKYATTLRMPVVGDDDDYVPVPLPDFLNSIIVGEKVEIDGQEYYEINVTKGPEDDMTVYGPALYMREDPVEKKVWARMADNDFRNQAMFDAYSAFCFDFKDLGEGEHLLYNFEDWGEGSFLPSYYYDIDKAQIEDLELEYNGETFYGECYDIFAQVEGLGFIPNVKHSTDPWTYHTDSPTLISLVQYVYGGKPTEYNPELLYEVTDGNGNVIFAIDEFRPTTDGIVSVTAEHTCKVGIEGGCITIVGNGPLGMVEVYSVSGQLVVREEAKSSSASIPAQSLAKGVYLVKVQGKTYKVVK